LGHKVLPLRQPISHEIDMASAAWWVNSVFDPRNWRGFETGTRRITMSYFYLLEDLGIWLRFILHHWADSKAIRYRFAGWELQPRALGA
jgi:hypothetical protein